MHVCFWFRHKPLLHTHSDRWEVTYGRVSGVVGSSSLKLSCVVTPHLWPLAGMAHLFDITGQLTTNRRPRRAVLLCVREVGLRKHTHTWTKSQTHKSKISNLSFKAFVRESVRQRHTILYMRYTHWFALRLGGVAGLAGAVALWLACEGWSAGGLEAAAAVTVSASNAQQHPEVRYIPAECWPERKRGKYLLTSRLWKMG